METCKRRKQDFTLKQHPMTEAGLDNLPPADELADDIIDGKLSGINRTAKKW